MLRSYSLKVKEAEYTARMLKTLNQELSPFKDEETRDSSFVREMLAHYKTAETFHASTTHKQVLRNDTQVHHYLKVMESGEGHKDAKMLKELHEGKINRDAEELKEYLTKRLQTVRGRSASGMAL